MYILEVMNSRYWYGLLVFLTLYMIFEDDVKRACAPPRVDLGLEIFITIVLVFFTVEMGKS